MKMVIRNFFRNNVVSSSAVRASEDISETHAVEDNTAQVSGINNETDECSVAMASIQKRKACNVKKCKWNINYTAYAVMGFIAQKEAVNPYPLVRYLFCFVLHIFEKSNQLDFLLQGKGSDVFQEDSTIEAFKQNLEVVAEENNNF